jgi:hypothetical protein
MTRPIFGRLVSRATLGYEKSFPKLVKPRDRGHDVQGLQSELPSRDERSATGLAFYVEIALSLVPTIPDGDDTF